MLLHHAVVGDVADVSEVHAASILRLTLKIEASCTPETSAISPTTTRCNNVRTELTSIINQHENLKSALSSMFHNTTHYSSDNINAGQVVN
jgi:hypothetical protein